ncbi:MAG: TolC family protein [Mucinivorans sp.]
MKYKLIAIILFSCLTIVGAMGQAKQYTLDECMRYATEQSFMTGRAWRNVSISRQDYTAAIGNHLPSINASVGASSNFGRGIDPATNTYINTTTFSNSYGANLSLPIFRAFSLLNNTLASKVARARAVSEYQKAMDDVALSVMGLFIDVLYNKGLVDLTARRVENFTKDLYRAQRMSELGTSSASDVAQFAATLAAEELSLVTRSNVYDQSLLSLKEKMNFPLEDTLLIATDIIAPVVEVQFKSAASIFEAAADYLPAIDILNKTLRIQKYNLKIARSGYYPSISAWAGASTNFFTNLTLPSSASASFGTQFRDNIGEGVSVSMSIPIFNGLNTRTSVAKARLAYDQAASDYNEQMRALRVEIERAVMDLETCQSQVAGAEKSVRASRLALRAAQGKYAEGVIDVIALNTTANQMMMAEVELLSARLQYEIKNRQVNYYTGVALVK